MLLLLATCSSAATTTPPPAHGPPHSPPASPRYYGNEFAPEAERAKGPRGSARVPRQVLRQLLLDELAPGTVQWDRALVRFASRADDVACTFAARSGARCAVRAGLFVACDGFNSAARRQLDGGADTSRYAGAVVLLGLAEFDAPLLRRRGFHTVDGAARLFTMPFADAPAPGAPPTVMWQLSFAVPSRAEAVALAARPPAALLEHARAACGGWHAPVPALLAATAAATVWGTALFDRPPPEARSKSQPEAVYRSRCVLVGDAAHPMPPFKGMGCNQALQDAVLLAAKLVPPPKRRRKRGRDGLVEAVEPAESAAAAAAAAEPAGPTQLPSNLFAALSVFERESGARAKRAMAASAAASIELHSPAVLDAPVPFAGVCETGGRAAALRAALAERGIGAGTEGLSQAVAAVLAEVGERFPHVPSTCRERHRGER